MAGDALLPSPVGRNRTFPDLLDLFAAAMLRRRGPDDATRAIVGRARSAARADVASSRAPLGSQQELALRSIYDEARAFGQAAALEATGESVLPGRTRAARTFEATLSLRHRQRAALLLHDLAGLPVASVADVIGVRPAQVHAIVEGARAAVVRRLGAPANVRRALADAGRRLIAPQVERETPPDATRMPRGVVRTLLAPVDGASQTDASPIEPAAAPPIASPAPATDAPPPIASPVPADAPGAPPPPLRAFDEMLAVDGSGLADAALRALEDVPADITVEPRPPSAYELRPAVRAPLAPHPRAPFPFRPVRVALVAACAVLLAVIVPASARSPRLVPPSAPRVSATVSTPAVAPARPAARAAVPAPDVVVVRPGDSLWAIAERRLGDPLRWGEIWRLNARAAMPGGRFTDPDLIRPGWRLRLPRAG